MLSNKNAIKEAGHLAKNRRRDGIGKRTFGALESALGIKLEKIPVCESVCFNLNLTYQREGMGS